MHSHTLTLSHSHTFLRLLDDPVLHRIHHQSGHGFGAGLGFEFIADGFHGARTDIDEVGDFLGGFFLAHHFQDGGLLFGEVGLLGQAGFRALGAQTG